jgi:hypothetical protein
MRTETFDEKYCEIAAKVLAGGESLAAVCAELDIARSTLYEWRDKYPSFAKALSQGLQKAQRVWENIGKEGITGDIKNFGGTPWMFTMKNRFRDDYRDDKDEKKDDAVSVLEKIISGELKVNHD